MRLADEIRVEQMDSPNSGRPVANQFLIHTPEGVYFQSYKTIIAFAPHVGGKIQLDHSWNCSATTGKYRNVFLSEGIADTRKRIKAGEYEVVDLN